MKRSRGPRTEEMQEGVRRRPMGRIGGWLTAFLGAFFRFLSSNWSIVTRPLTRRQQLRRCLPPPVIIQLSSTNIIQFCRSGNWKWPTLFPFIEFHSIAIGRPSVVVRDRSTTTKAAQRQSMISQIRNWSLFATFNELCFFLFFYGIWGIKSFPTRLSPCSQRTEHWRKTSAAPHFSVSSFITGVAFFRNKTGASWKTYPPL